MEPSPVTTYIPGVAPISSRTSRSRKFWNFQHGTETALQEQLGLKQPNLITIRKAQ
jgi:hypothetical protein